MNIVEVRTFAVGRFTVRQQPRFDNPGWAQYLVFLNGKLIGKHFSLPDEGCCEWLARHWLVDHMQYAKRSSKPHRWGSRGLVKARAISANRRRKPEEELEPA